MSGVAVSTTINGEPAEFLCEPRQSLLECLRDVSVSPAPRKAAATVTAAPAHDDGHPLVCSCLVLGVEARGSRIETIEGIARGNELHPLQKKLPRERRAPVRHLYAGIHVAAKALLDEEPDPSEERIRFYLANNLCRCTGYDKIIRAVQDAAKEMREAKV